MGKKRKPSKRKIRQARNREDKRINRERRKSTKKKAAVQKWKRRQKFYARRF